MVSLPQWCEKHNMQGWSRCTACGDPYCDTVHRECVHGCIAIIPRFIGGHVKLMSARGQESIEVFSLDEAMSVANEKALTLGGWLPDVKKAVEAKGQ